MSEFVYKDYLPANARVIVDYKAHEKVRFSYPISWSYKKAVWRRAYLTITSFWYALHITMFNNLFIPFLIFISLRLIFFPFELVTRASNVSYNFMFFFKYIILFYLLPLVFYMLGISAIATYYLSRNKERLSYWVPKIGYWTQCLMGSVKEKIFKVEDIDNNKLILHNFGNVYLDYKCSGDFSKYLTKVEVMEIPFNYLKEKWFFSYLSILKLFIKNRNKKEKNDFEFRAVFYFSQKPEKGDMKLLFV